MTAAFFFFAACLQHRAACLHVLRPDLQLQLFASCRGLYQAHPLVPTGRLCGGRGWHRPAPARSHGQHEGNFGQCYSRCLGQEYYSSECLPEACDPSKVTLSPCSDSRLWKTMQRFQLLQLLLTTGTVGSFSGRPFPRVVHSCEHPRIS